MRLLDGREEAIVDGMLGEGGRTKITRKQKEVVKILIPMKHNLIILRWASVIFFFEGYSKEGRTLRRGRGGGQGLCKIP